MPPDQFPPPISPLQLELTPLDGPCPVFAGHDPAPGVLDSIGAGESVIALDLHNESGSWVKINTVRGTTGWCHLSGLVPTLASSLPWVRVAQGEVGTSMTTKHKIQAYIDSVPGYKDKWVEEWCGCFMTWCMKRSGGEVIEVLPERAQRWLQWGKPREEGQVPGQVPALAAIGDLAIGQNGGEADTRGHVAFYLGTNGTQVLVLGGNQSAQPLKPGGEKAVRYSWYPLESTDPPARLLSVNGPR